jgi:NADPH-dependent 2,4-dienoyl-CoA reductase/sulfur reductase-like enzyme
MTPLRRRGLLGAMAAATLAGAAGRAWAGQASASASASAALPPQAPAQGGQARARVLIVGGGWGGLAAAHALGRDSAGRLDVTLIDRSPQWRSLPLSSAWLVGRAPEHLPRLDLAELGRRQGWRFVAADVQAIDRPARRLDTSAGAFAYDWLILATGATYDDAAWYGGDARAQAEARTRFPAGFQASELDGLQRALQGFQGGDLLLTVPTAPYRCPPAPYERAVLLAGWIRARGLRAKVTLLDAGGGMPRYTRLFNERWRGLIEHRPYSELRSVDPWAKTAATDDGEFHFDHALLLPPMGAGALIAQAGLLGRGQGTAGGQPSRWAAVDPLSLRAQGDERVFIVGDALDSVSILFGAYPKTAQIAADLGAAAARQVLTASLGQALPPAAELLPASQCHVWLDADPPEQLRIDTSYRLRGDGVIVQTVRQVDNPQPRDEDLQWARGVMAARLGVG